MLSYYIINASTLIPGKTPLMRTVQTRSGTVSPQREELPGSGPALFLLLQCRQP